MSYKVRYIYYKYWDQEINNLMPKKNKHGPYLQSMSGLSPSLSKPTVTPDKHQYRALQ